MEGKFLTARKVRLGGRTLPPGRIFDTTGLADHKVQQLLRQRILRPVTAAIKTK